MGVNEDDSEEVEAAVEEVGGEASKAEESDDAEAMMIYTRSV